MHQKQHRQHRPNQAENNLSLSSIAHSSLAVYICFVIRASKSYENRRYLKNNRSLQARTAQARAKNLHPGTLRPIRANRSDTSSIRTPPEAEPSPIRSLRIPQVLHQPLI